MIDQVLLRTYQPSDLKSVLILHKEGLIQPQLCAQFTNLLRGGVLPQQEHHGIADILEQHESDESHRDHDNHGLNEAAQDKSKHQKSEE